MPISGTRRLMTGGWGNPKLDLKDPSLVLYAPLWYPDSETTGSTIISKDINRHSCTVTTATWGNQGRTFDGTNDFISAGDHSTINNALSAVTVDMWFKCLGTNKTASNFHYLLYKAAAGTWVAWYLVEAGTTLTVRANIGAGTNEASAAVLLNTWYHAAQVFDGSTNELFVNGVSADSVAAVGSLDDPSGSNLELGRSGTEYFWGIIGEVRIYDRALSAAEILYHYQTARWRFN